MEEQVLTIKFTGTQSDAKRLRRFIEQTSDLLPVHSLTIILNEVESFTKLDYKIERLIFSLGFSEHVASRWFNIVYRAGYHYVEEFLALDDDACYNHWNYGMKSHEVTVALRSHFDIKQKESRANG